MSTPTKTLDGWVGPEFLADSRLRRAAAMLAFVVAMALGAQVAVRLPFTQVPVTLQPLFVVLAGSVLGARAGSLAMAMYVLIGAAGAPVFSNGAAGLPWLLGPTGGYLLAMPAAAYAVGMVAGAGAGTVRTLAGLTLGIGVIYLGGVSQLMLLTGQGLGTALALGVVPFLAGDVTKVLLAAVATRLLRGPGLGRL